MVADLRTRLELLDARLLEALRSDVAFIESIGDDLVRAGGKRLRPTLAFLAADLVGCPDDDAMLAALCVELLHSASLLHDDLMDGATVRRGTPTAAQRYGSAVSVMAGDFMLARVLGILAERAHVPYMALVSETATRVCEGEVLQFQSASLGTWSHATYRSIIEGKTGALFAGALVGPAILAGAPEAQRAALHEFGMAYGRAFQMRDDYLDLLGDPEALGKPVGSDLREGKATLPVLCLIEEGVSEARAILSRRASEPGDVERMVGLVHEHGGDARTRSAIHAEVGLALEALTAFRRTPARGALAELAAAESDRVA